MPIAPDRILYEDQHLLVVHKRPGELTVAAGGEGKMPLFDFLHKDHPGLRVVHRLDFGTSGVLVFAKTAAAVAAIRSSKFAGWKKEYVTLVHGVPSPSSGVITKPLPARTHEDLVPARTEYRVTHAFPHCALVSLTIDTGRKHQIRRHLAGIGHPLVLDPLYGDARQDRKFKKRFSYRRLFLHAASLTFPHPITGEKLHVAAPLPPTFREVMGKLRGGRAVP
ncbi:MAG: 23S rRNA pseudouridine synthase [Candidatus Peregrinibacteria bacterium Gr01-1014_25]|nr:MAG: 23S rRNA pseudouridine synthase [Candidatus Peregrinibacteria bacterium Gr01-1014_25]